MGLSGTGSKSVVVKDVTVADTHSVTIHDLKTGTAPGGAFTPAIRSTARRGTCSRCSR